MGSWIEVNLVWLGDGLGLDFELCIMGIPPTCVGFPPNAGFIPPNLDLIPPTFIFIPPKLQSFPPNCFLVTFFMIAQT
jgi:hypothetical protein